jgi:hypothetical protein
MQGNQMLDEERKILMTKLDELTLEHRDLDDVIATLTVTPDFDQLKISRMKKRKLLLKDQITKLHSKLIPDIEA